MFNTHIFLYVIKPAHTRIHQLCCVIHVSRKFMSAIACWGSLWLDSLFFLISISSNATRYFVIHDSQSACVLGPNDFALQLTSTDRLDLTLCELRGRLIFTMQTNQQQTAKNLLWQIAAGNYEQSLSTLVAYFHAMTCILPTLLYFLYVLNSVICL